MLKVEQFGIKNAWRGGGAMIFSFDKSTSLDGGVRKKTEMIRGGGEA